MPTIDTLDIDALNEKFEYSTAEDILKWAWNTFGTDVVLSSSFQTQSVPLLHLISKICPELPILFLDTEFHFPETLKFRDELKKLMNLNIITIYPTISEYDLFMQYGATLYKKDPDLCCYIHKVEPLEKALLSKKAWISGVRRDQTQHRSSLRFLEPQKNKPLKIHPLLNWTKKDLWAYIDKHSLPPHPLFHKGYLSVGCAPCTRPVMAGEDERAGRWSEAEKKECGLHIDLNAMVRM